MNTRTKVLLRGKKREQEGGNQLIKNQLQANENYDMKGILEVSKTHFKNYSIITNKTKRKYIKLLNV